MTLAAELKQAYRFHKAQLSRNRRPIIVATLVETGVDVDTARATVQRTAELALKKARADVAAGVKRYTVVMWTGYGNPAAFNEAGRQCAYVESLAHAGLRFVDYADHWMNGRDSHMGWFADHYRDRLYRGCVLQLPGRKGHARFVAAYEDPDNGGYVLDLSRGTVFSERGDSYLSVSDMDAARDCSRAADSFAESEAEEAREYDTAWQAGSQWAGLAEVISDARKAALAILSERRKVMWSTDDGKPPVALCDAIRDKVESLLDTIRETRAKRAELESGDAESFYFYDGDSRLVAAFNEGAGR